MRPTFFISNLDFTKEGGRGHNNSAVTSLNTNANNMPKTDLALNISKLITKLVSNAGKTITARKKPTKKWVL